MFDSTKKFNSDCNEFQNLQCRFSSNKIVVYKSNHTRKITIHQEEQAKVNFERKEYNGYMSRQTKAYITKTLDTWFLTCRHWNNNKASKLKQRVKKMVFFTLTLPSTQIHSDNEIKRDVLNKFIISMTRTGTFDSYFWRAEKQQNGNIHFHFLIDVFISKELLQTQWNMCLERLGYIDEFEKKYNHRNPPTTQIQVIPSNQNIIDYVVKYVGKNECSKKVQGRIWGMSDKLRELKAFVYDNDRESENVINQFTEEKGKNVYQDENCMVIMVRHSDRCIYYKKLEDIGLNKTMDANVAYLYLDGALPVDVLFPKRVYHVNSTIEKKVDTQFELFERNFNTSKI